MTLSAYLSAPCYNDAQVKGHSLIQDAITESGFEVVNPNAIPVLNPDGSQKSAHILAEERFCLLDQGASLFVGWADQLLSPGFKMMVLTNVESKVEVPLPEQMVQYLSIGMQAAGVAKVRPKSGLIIPGRDDPRGLEVANVPNSITIQPQGGVIGRYVSGPLNFPDPLVMFEMGVAFQKGIPIVLLTLASPAIGLMGAHAYLLVPSFEELRVALKEAASTLGDPASFRASMKSLTERYRKEAAEKREKMVAQIVAAEADSKPSEV